MSNIVELIKLSHKKPRVALFLSGTGSNARKILEMERDGRAAFTVAVLVTDVPEKSAAVKFGEEFSVPVIKEDISAFYWEHGEEKTALTTPRRRELRDLWSEKLWQEVKKYDCDFGVLAGFFSLSNIVSRIPCVNVHPGDLTWEIDGVRVLAGLHCLPVENAILRERGELRSSVILAQAYSGVGKNEIDSGPVLAVSAPVGIDMAGTSIAELKEISASRATPPHKDKLREIALNNIETLKVKGDHVILPFVVNALAKGCYGTDGTGGLYFRESADAEWEQVETVECSPDGTHTLRRKSPAPRKRAGKIKRFFKYWYIKIVRTPGTPQFVARGWALGVAVGCIVPVFCQLIVALPLAFVFRCSKVGAAAGTFVTTPPTAIFIYPIQIWVGNKIINGNLSGDTAGKLVEVFNNSQLGFAEKWSAFADMGGELVAAFFAGGIAWAAFMTPLTYWGVKWLVVSYRSYRDKKRIAAGGRAQ